MNRATSTYLDAVRFLAACFVFLHHLNGWSGNAISIFAPMQSQAVIVFFVLSGCVIGFVVDRKETRLVDYVVSRLSRLYSVALPALLVTFLLDTLGSILAPESYGAHFTFSLPGIGLQFAAGLLFLNEVWSHHILIGTNAPFWSLGYEVPYYIAFGGYAFAPRKWKWFLPALVLATYGPRVAILAPIWLMGFASYRICSRRTLGMVAGWWLFIGSAVTWVAFYTAVYLGLVPSTIAAVYWHHWEIWQDYAVGILFAANVVGFHAISAAFMPLADRCQRPVRWVAGATFTLYLFHSPVAEFLIAILKWPMNRATNMVGLTLIVFLIVFALAEVTERRKSRYRGVISRILGAYPANSTIGGADSSRRDSIWYGATNRLLPR